MADYISTYTGAEIDAGLNKTDRITNGQYVFDDTTATNSWRIRSDSGRLVFERYSGSQWEEKGFFQDSIHSDYGYFKNMILPAGATPSQAAPADSLMFHMHQEDQGDGTTLPRPYFMDSAGTAFRIIAAHPDGKVRTYNQTTHASQWLATEDYVTNAINSHPGTAVQVQSDWNEASTSSPAFIKNKPTVGEQNVQSDWNETDAASDAYIKNKPDDNYLTGVTVNTDKTADFHFAHGATMKIDFSTWFSTQPSGDSFVYWAFVDDRPPTDPMVMKAGTKIDSISDLDGLSVTMTRSESTQKYMAFWYPTSLGTVTHMNTGGFNDVWQQWDLTIDGVVGKVAVSDNKTTATSFSFVVGAA